MNNEKRHFEEELGFDVSPRFSKDLSEVFTPGQDVPSNINRTIVETARRHLVRRQPKLWWVRWAVPATAAAAVIVAASIWWVIYDHGRQVARTSHSEVAKDSSQVYESLRAWPAQADIDRNGRVDILDAFKLARHIESGRQTDKLWDINGDGIINRKDVDKVAFAAVRLDKGVL